MDGEDHLAAAGVRNLVPGAVVVHRARPFHAEARLQRSWLVVDAGVDHAGAVAGLVCGQLALALEHAYAAPAAAREQLARHGEPENAPADDGDVTPRRGRSTFRRRPRRRVLSVRLRLHL